MLFFRTLLVGFLLLAIAKSNQAQELAIKVDATKQLHPVSHLLTGACIEDVNHEIYGGFYSQMIFGESFQEPATASTIEGFKAYEGEWEVENGVLHISGGQGNKLVSDSPTLRNGEVSVDVKFEDRTPGNAGLILQVSKAKNGADNFYGYEISLDPALQIFRLGRHRNNWEHIRDVPCEIKVGQWINLQVKLDDGTLAIDVDGVNRLTYEDHDNHSLHEGLVGLRQWQRGASFRNLKVMSESKLIELPFEKTTSPMNHAVSSMWQASETGTAVGQYEIVRSDSFVGTQCQKIRFVNGQGTVCINNKGLNRWGLHLQQGKEYEGVVYAKTDSPCELWVGAENSDGSQVMDEKKLNIASSEWKRIEFCLTPNETVVDGRFTLKLKMPGSVLVGYVSLQPGPWGRFENLPVRRDVAEMLQRQGINILRYGGSMINNDQ
ncbi:hypothetical protein CA13_15910 [Planctomycetes bacterium CA13]|uniref:3-keto-alpha-glucoside-1,2-lyase/3-keto-2-hydroxy-glucal hydratase domain-containing protein n=1 Tax=Novipirellula herctigrandis TaxID=2527986 RepID=A0A5C5YYK5_9BACT|nr:hypothetical protein CA13_15910 [Planctomycetes bacterium CA13]